MTKITQRNELNAAVEAFLAKGGKITVEAPGEKSRDTQLNKFGVTAWGKTATISNHGRQYNKNRTDVAGSNTNNL